MAREHGVAGHALRNRLLLLVGVLLLTGIATYLAVRLISPILAPLAPIAGLLVILKLLQDKDIRSKFVRVGKGYVGERSVGKTLSELPAGWRVFHDVQLDGENADHVVVSSRGVFTIEVKNYAGQVKATPSGLYTHGKRNDKIVKQAWRQTHALREQLGVEVEPLLVFCGGRLEGDAVGRLRVLSLGDLVPHLLSLTERKLEYDDARRVFDALDAITAGSQVKASG